MMFSVANLFGCYDLAKREKFQKYEKNALALEI